MRRSLSMLLLAAAACGGPKTQAKSPDHAEVVATPPPAPTPAPPPSTPTIDESSAVALDPSVRTGVLPNGLTYFVKANKKPEKRVQLWLAVNSGSVLETDEQRGYSHLLEHIAFQGTKRFPKREIQDFIERAGMVFGADLNAYTSFDETVFQLMVPTDDAKIVDKGIDVLRDWSTDITFDPKAVLDERRIIEEERRVRNSAGFRMLQQILPVEYQGTKYGERLPIGTVEMIAAANADKLKKLYQTWYRPEMMAVIVVGDVDPVAIEAELKKKFGDIAPAAATATKRPIATANYDVPPRLVVARDKEQAVFEIEMDYLMPHRPDATIADARREMVELVFGEIVNQRLDAIAKRGTSAWTAAHVSVGGFLRPLDQVSLEATAKTGARVLDAVGDLTAEMARVRQHGFTTEEMDQARAALMQGFEEGAKEVETRDSRSVATGLVRNYLTHAMFAGPLRELELAKSILPTITADQVVGIAKSLHDKGRVVTIEAPPKGDVPSETDINKRIAEATDKPIGAWQAVDLSQPILAADPKPGSVTAEKSLGNGIVQWTLSNGATAYLKKTDFKVDEVMINATSNGGSSQVADADFVDTEFAPNIINASGFGNYSVEDLKKKLAGKKVEVATAIDNEHENVIATSSPDDLEPTLQLMHAAFTAPRRDQAAFDAWKTKQMMTASVIEANAQAKFILGAFGYIYEGNQRMPLPFPTKKKVEAVKLDNVMTQYQRRFANAADFAFVIVGNFDQAKLKPLVEKYIASLPAQKGKHETVKDVKLHVKKGVASTTFKIGSEQKSISLLVAPTDAAWSFALAADADILQHVLNIELLETLRQKLGGTYSVSTEASITRYPPSRVDTLVFFESDPARAASMQAETWKVLDEMATKPVSADTIAKVKEQIQKAFDASLLENQFWVTTLARYGRYNDAIDKQLDIAQVTSKVTAEHVQKIAAQLVGKKNRLTITLMPEDAAKP